MLLQINRDGKIINQIKLGNTPSHMHRSLIAINKNVYLASNNNKILIINIDGDTKELEIGNTNEVFEVHSLNNKLIVLYTDGSLYEMNDKNIIKKISVSFTPNYIPIKSIVRDGKIYLLSVLDEQKNNRKDLSYGEIKIFDLNNKGNLLKRIELKNESSYVISGFEIF